MDGYCKRYVDAMGEDAEGALIDFGILPRCLGCDCNIIYLSTLKLKPVQVPAHAQVQL